MSTSSAGMRRLCAAVDLEAYSHQNNPDQSFMQRELVDVLHETCQHATPGQAPEVWQFQGDGGLGVLPPGADETRAVADMLRELRIALDQHNGRTAAKVKLRLRVAMHSGIVHDAAAGFAGDAAVVVFRLLAAQPLRKALREHPETDLVLIVSDQLYDDIVRHDYRDLRAETFRRVRVDDRRKRFTARAWIHVAEPVGAGGSAAAQEGSGPDTDGGTAPNPPDEAGGDRPDTAINGPVTFINGTTVNGDWIFDQRSGVWRTEHQRRPPARER